MIIGHSIGAAAALAVKTTQVCTMSIMFSFVCSGVSGYDGNIVLLQWSCFGLLLRAFVGYGAHN